MSNNNFVTECFYNLTWDERIDLFKRRQGLRLDHVYKTYYGYMALPFAIVGIFVTIFFIVTVYDAIKAKRVSRKCYILLLNRAIGDLFTCITALLSCAYIFTTKDINRDLLVVMETFFIGSFWSGMISYVALSLLKLFAVARPFDYRKCVTMKRCIYLIIASWVVFIVMISYALGVTALVKVRQLNEWSGCKMETCLRVMYRTRNFVTVIVYCFTLVVFAITVVLIQRAQRFVDSFKRNNRSSTEGRPTLNNRTSRFPMWKLALNVSTFAGLYLFYVIWCIVLLFNKDSCFFQKNLSELLRILAFIRISMMLRIILDPLLSFITDHQIRRGFLNLVGIHRKLTFSGSRSMFRDKSMVTDNSSEGNMPSTRRSAVYPLERDSRPNTVELAMERTPST